MYIFLSFFIIKGTLWFYQYKGLAAAHFMNKMEYDVMVRLPTQSSLYNDKYSLILGLFHYSYGTGGNGPWMY